ncbi:unnamed protein product [Prunus armeniaca]|uniref:WAT1-related protein n=1 Tax=Prunus armeniaca TaxID=36596 RepID=A0A6J5W945_PRUAR|nr:unnamed protein product [Prunus armeniaca]
MNITPTSLDANDGMSLKVFSAYRVLFASAVMIPLALFYPAFKRVFAICLATDVSLYRPCSAFFQG